MPLRERTIVDIREEMALAALDGSISEVAAAFGVSRPTVRLWRDRYRAEGRSALRDRSHAPRGCPHRTAEAIEALIVAERKRWGWGSKKLLARLRERYPDLSLPGRSTADAILSRHGLVVPHKRERSRLARPAIGRYRANDPGELTTIDYKGHFRLRNGRYCYPLTLMDSVSRYLLACEALASTQFRHAWPVIERVFREHGLPQAVQSDNGPPFGTANGYSRMSVMLMSLGVQPVFSRPGRPQDNGCHERMHRELKADILQHRGWTHREQQNCFNRFRHDYNVERPHEGIGQDRPARRFRSSPRGYPHKPRRPEYAEHWEKRKVTTAGTFSWRGKIVFLSESFAGQTIALEPIDVDRSIVRFYQFNIGCFDEGHGRIS